MVRSDPAGRNRTSFGPVHQTVAFALVPLIQGRRAAGDEHGPQQRMEQLHPGPRPAEMGAEQEPDAGAHQDEQRDARLGELQIAVHEVTAWWLDSAVSTVAAARTLRRTWIASTTLAARVRPPVATWLTVLMTMVKGYSAALRRAMYA